MNSRTGRESLELLDGLRPAKSGGSSSLSLLVRVELQIPSVSEGDSAKIYDDLDMADKE